MKKAIVPALVLALLLLYSASYAVTLQAKKAATDQLLSSYPFVRLYHESDRLTRVYGQSFGSGNSPQEAAEQFAAQYAPIFGVDPSELLPVSPVVQNGNTLPVMYLEEEGRYKFTLVYYSQYREGIPVYMADLRLLVRNEPGYPLVLAASALRDLGDFHVDQTTAAISPQAAQQAFAARNPQYVDFSEPRQIIWAGIDELKVEPALGVLFTASAAPPDLDKFKYIVEPLTGEILYKENMIIDVDVVGNVDGYATENFKAEQCGSEISTDMPWARVYINGGNTAFADSAGHYVIPNGGSSPVTVFSYVRGQWFQVWNNAGNESYLSQSVTPPGPANFLHNPGNTEYTRAEVNAYVHSNLVRDYTLKFHPTYPGIYNDVDFPVYVNRADGYCPGNAWYDNFDFSINFCSAGSGYPNTAFSTIVHHEYGHHLVEMAGSGQGQYGEGMGDVMGLLITDDPGAAWGFYGPCNQALRNAVNSIQYPCSDEIHYCGQLLSGCVWETRNELLLTNPTTYRNIIANLAINAMLLHTGTSIGLSITIDYLTLDDDDGNIGNGTPHHSEICTGFGEHNMDCPPLDLLVFSYPNGRPEFVHPFGGTTCRVVVTGAAGTPQPNTGQLHYNAGAGWVTVPMTQISPNVYDAVFPAVICRTEINYYFSAQTTGAITVNDPENAPSSFYTTTSGTGVTVLYQDDFSTNLGWSGLGGTAEWAMSAATGGAGDDTHGSPDPSTDHSPSGDNRVLGNDNTAGTGGDYSAGITSTQWVTSPIINCSGQNNISLTFWRWLGVEQGIYDDAFLQAYNGSTWTNLFQNPANSTIDESAWSEQRYNVSPYANNNANFRIRFGLGTTDGSWQFCGWNIDDIKVTTVQCDTIRNGIIAGVISDINGPVASALVHAASGGDNGWDTTAANGSYSMSVPQNTYGVTVTHFDHRDTTLAGIVVTSNDTTTLDVLMQRLPGTVKGTVTRGPLLPIANVRVVAVGSGKEDTTDAAGLYRINGLADGAFNVFYTNPDYRDTTITGVNITPGDTTTVNVVMQQLPGWIAGVVRDSGSVPIESVIVIINNSMFVMSTGIKQLSEGRGGPLILAVDSLYTNSAGYYASRLAATNYNVTFRKNDYNDTTITGIAVTPNDTSDVSPVLGRYNHPPVITSPATAGATEDIAFSYIAAAADSDGVVPAIAFSNYPGWMNALGDTIRGTPLEGDGNTSFRIIASDGYKADTQMVAVTVTAVNDPPAITSADRDTASEHQAFSYTTTATDPDNPTLSYSFAAFPAWLIPSGATISGTTPEGAANTSFLAIVSDGALADSQLVTLIVLAVDDPPVITSPAAVTATEDVSFTYIAAAYDPEGAIASIAIDQLPAWLTATVDTVRGTPLEGYVDTTFRIIASDGGLSDTLIVAVDVIPVNDAPLVTSVDTATAVEDQQFNYTGTANDPDGTTPTISFADYPAWLAPAGNVISGIPLNGDGDATFNVIASDGSLADTVAVTVDVLPVNDAPVITSAATDTAVGGQPFAYVGTALDIDGPSITITFANYPSWLVPHNDTLSGTPPVGAPDTSFMTIASDGLLADSLIVTVVVQMPNSPPQITSAPNATATEDIPFSYVATATDPDGTTPSISFPQRPSWMAVVGDTISGTPLEGFVDTSFTIVASDSALSDTQVVSVDVIAVNDAPIITSASEDTAEIDIPYFYLGTAIDPDGTEPLISFAHYAAWMSVSGPAIMGMPPVGSSDTSFEVIAYDGQYHDSLLVFVTMMGGCRYMPGDVNGDGAANGIDVTFSVTFLKGGAPPPDQCDCPPHGMLYVAGDVNGNCAYNGIDITFFVAFLKELQPSLGWCEDCPPSGPAIAPPGTEMPASKR
ncbi:MAG: hypothetical protein A2W25_05600 [candidate division Zixibacteria bacterium RBG_16_53_22]|nr:MAG: hypothetical protein A2W25_05600 [candidate division Zixibacteria bacterium RBG_16_53_22]